MLKTSISKNILVRKTCPFHPETLTLEKYFGVVIGIFISLTENVCRFFKI